MRSSRIRIDLWALLVGLLSSGALAQSTDTSEALAPNSVLAGFNQNINTMTWNGLANKDWISDNYRISLDEQFRSVVIKSQQNLIRDEQGFSGMLKRNIFGNVFGFANLQSNYVSDTRQIGLNSVGASELLGGLSYENNSDTLSAGIGNKWDQQAGVNNSGITYDIHGATFLSPSDGSQLLPSILVHDEQISPRRNFDRIAGLSYSQSFTPRSSVMFLGSYAMQLRDFYFPADPLVSALYKVANNIQSRDENRGSYLAGLSTPFLFFQLTTHAGFGDRDIEYTYRYKPAVDTVNTLYDTRIKVSTFSFDGQVMTELSGDTLSLTMAHSERSETHSLINISTANAFTALRDSSEAQLNNVGTRNTLSGRIVLHFGSISAGITGLASILRYNTPSDLNFDDRDELTNTLLLYLGNRFSPFFEAGIGLEADMIHIVYITSQRSANNSRNFIYRLTPAISYTGPAVNSFNRFEVLANYTVYDYEAFSEVHSFSFRQASFLDSTSVQITDKLSAFVLANVKLYSRGELYWSTFSEYPLNYFVDETFWLSFAYRSGAAAYGAGYKYLSLTQYNYVTATERQFGIRQVNAGPTAFLSIGWTHLRLTVGGWYQISRQTLQNPVVYPNFELKAAYIF